jgi:uncharacterized protein YndB with AHSA1/START domain
MWTVLVIALVLAALLLVLYLVARTLGARYPPDHHFTREVVLKAPPERVWAAVTDFAAAPAWNPLVKRSRREPDHDGHEAWREWLAAGPPMLMLTKESEAPRRLVREIVDEKQSFGGTWTFVLTEAEGGTHVRLSEDGMVPGPVFRFMVRRFGPGRYVERYLEALARHLGEAGAPVRRTDLRTPAPPR